jgi:hypothetical protein
MKHTRSLVTSNFNVNFYYQDTITITSKGLEVELVKIPNYLTVPLTSLATTLTVYTWRNWRTHIVIYSQPVA